ncbi:hypothetical protein [Pedobacter deserti]|uniref:hypothetical protein n=1 Tax=Pedobacter deserti TaxID=2817382 RepID=UPI00210B424E|nr:hypothetical protein [Pedobacter sp. SYSU D00382]
MVNKLFYIVYNSYYKHGNYKRDIPALTVGGIFCAVVFSLFLTAHFMFFYEKDEGKEMISWLGCSKGQLIFHSIFIAAMLITYFRFFWRNTHRAIYEQFKADEYLNSRKAKFIGFAVVLFFILLPILYAIIKAYCLYGSLYITA